MKRLALAAAAVIVTLGLINPAAAQACERRYRGTGYGYGYGPPVTQFSLSFGAPPVIVYRNPPPPRFYASGPGGWGHGPGRHDRRGGPAYYAERDVPVPMGPPPGRWGW